MLKLATALSNAPIKALFFDLDDTLYESAPIYALGLERAWSTFQQTSYGKLCEFDRFKELYAAARERTKKSLIHSPSKNSRLIYFHHLVSSIRGAPLAKLVFELDQAYASAYDSIDFSPARCLLKSLKAVFKIAIVTNQTMEAQFAKLANLDPDGDLIDLIVTSESVGFEKPDARVFETALAELSLSPKEAVMIGDNLNQDILGARAVGLHCIYITNNPKEVVRLELENPLLGRVGVLEQIRALLIR